MKVPYAQLARALGTGLAPVYLVAGDEPLLVGEALARIRDAAKSKGFTERELHVVDRGFDWNLLESQSDSLSPSPMTPLAGWSRRPIRSGTR